MTASYEHGDDIVPEGFVRIVQTHCPGMLLVGFFHNIADRQYPPAGLSAPSVRRRYVPRDKVAATMAVYWRERQARSNKPAALQL